jgi:hypothetical protein
MKMIGVNDILHKRIKNLSEITGKKIYRLIEEAIVLLETKYRIVSSVQDKDKK